MKRNILFRQKGNTIIAGAESIWTSILSSSYVQTQSSPGTLDSRENINLIANQYDQLSTIFDSFPIAAKDDPQIFLDRMPKKNNARALDIGCGTGRTVSLLSKHFDEVQGIDLSSGMIKIAKLRCEGKSNVSFEQCDIRQMSLPEKSFDYIVSHTTFHHLDRDLIPALKQIKKSLKPEGKVVFIDIIAKGLMKNHAALVRKIGAMITLLSQLYKGSKTRIAFDDFKKAVDPKWMEHLRTDKFLSERDFIKTYDYIFEGASFEPLTKEYGLNHLMIVEWSKECK